MGGAAGRHFPEQFAIGCVFHHLHVGEVCRLLRERSGRRTIAGAGVAMADHAIFLIQLLGVLERGGGPLHRVFHGCRGCRSFPGLLDLLRGCDVCSEHHQTQSPRKNRGCAFQPIQTSIFLQQSHLRVLLLGEQGALCWPILFTWSASAMSGIQSAGSRTIFCVS